MLRILFCHQALEALEALRALGRVLYNRVGRPEGNFELIACGEPWLYSATSFGNLHRANGSEVEMEGTARAG